VKRAFSRRARDHDSRNGAAGWGESKRASRAVITTAWPKRRPGFAESDLNRWLEEAGFKKIEINLVAAEEQPPHFQTILAGGEKSRRL